jgi:eukaryotic-like serine/threonine-protein kinase
MTILRNHKLKIFLKRIVILVSVMVMIVLTGCFSSGSVKKGWSGGVLDGNTLYLGSKDGRLISVNVTDGSKKWDVPLETGTTTSGLGCSRVAIVAYIYGNPVVSDNKVYVGGYNGKIYSFIPGENQTDRTLEKIRVGDKDITIGSIIGSIIADNGNLYFGSSDGNVYAVDGRLQPIWEHPFVTKGKIWSTPTISKGTVYIGSFDNNLYALNASNGTSKWVFNAKGAFVATPIVDENTVYAGSFDRNIYAIDTNTGTLRWSFQGKHGFWATPIVNNGMIYAPCLDGKVYVLRTTDGYKVAEIDLKAAISSSPVLVGETIIVSTETSKGSGTLKKGAAIWAIDIFKNQGREITRLTGEQVDAPLSTDGESVFVHTDKDLLYGININTGALRQFTLK